MRWSRLDERPMLGDAGTTIEEFSTSLHTHEINDKCLLIKSHHFLFSLGVEFHTFIKYLSAIICISDS